MLGYPPVLRALFALLLAGVSFPLVGVLILRMNLITLRFALMHGALLGGALGLVLGLHPVLTTVIVNAVMVAAIARLARSGRLEIGAVTTMLMVIAIALAAAASYRFNVPAKDALMILWGDVYAMRPVDLVLTGAFATATIAAAVAWHRPLIAVMYDSEIAAVSGIGEPAIFYGVLFAVAITVAVAMRLLGALLLDVLVILPAIIALRLASSARGTFLIASAAGAAAAAGGFFVSIGVDIPASTGVALVSVLILGAGFAFRAIALKLKNKPISGSVP
jgi:zinc transport system permease protein